MENLAKLREQAHAVARHYMSCPRGVMSSRLCTNCRVSRSSSFRKPPASLAGPQQHHGQSPSANPPCLGGEARLLPLHPAPSGAAPAS